MKSQLRYFYKIWKKIGEEYFPKQKASSKAVCKSLFLMLKFVLAALLVAPVALCDRLLLKSGEPFLFFLSIVLTVAYYFWAANCIKNTRKRRLTFPWLRIPQTILNNYCLPSRRNSSAAILIPILACRN